MKPAESPIRIVGAAVSAADLKLSGPATGALGQPVVVTVSGLPAVELAQNVGEQTKWIESLRFEVSAPGTEVPQLEKELSMSVSPWAWKLRLTLTPKVAGTHVLVCDWNIPPFGLAMHRVDVGGSTVPPSKPDQPDPKTPIPDPSQPKRVTYVYEKDQSTVPRPVALALQKLNDASPGGCIATEFEEDTVTGDGTVPEQYKLALAAAKKEGLPALVVEVGGKVVKVVRAPTTAKQVEDAVKP
jgi:hypothetical protein